MFQNFLKILILAIVSSSSLADDRVSNWLQEMGCDELLITYLEEKLQNGTQQEKFTAANNLADLYKRILSLDKYRNNTNVLQRATQLLKDNSQIGTNSLKVQLLRARYLSAEKLLENYRLRYVTREDAAKELEQLKEINSGLETIRKSLMAKAKHSSKSDLYDLIGMTTSLLAWSHYYIAWFENSDEEADKAQNYFAMILQAETPTYQKISLDLKAKEYGARAILGIALCKKIIFDSAQSDIWFDELEMEETNQPIRMQIPMWRYFQTIDDHSWPLILQQLEVVNDENKLLYARLAAVHALDNRYKDTKGAQEVADKSLSLLIELGQLTMVSEIVELYGNVSLPDEGFISNYIQGDLLFRKLSDKLKPGEPTSDPEIYKQLIDISTLFDEAIASEDANEFPTFLNDCYYMLGLSLFQASEFQEASLAFQEVSTRQNDEDSLWMAIVCLDRLAQLEPSMQSVKNGLIKKYRNEWPNSTRASQLLVRDAAVSQASSGLVNELLSVSSHDPHYAQSQKQAAVHLYDLWSQVQETQVHDIGNMYVNVALQILLEKVQMIESGNEEESEAAIVLALRILEISLHQQIDRKVAAQHALDAIEVIKSKTDYNLTAFNKEIKYRTILFALSNGNANEAEDFAVDFITAMPNDLWSLYVAKAIWRYWDVEQIDVQSEVRFFIGSRLLSGLSDDEIQQDSVLPISYATSFAGFELAESKSQQTLTAGIEALRIARILQTAFPKTNRILKLVALLEELVGDSDIALAHWRTIASGNKQGSDQWLNARLHIVQILSTTNPSDAIDVLNQHHLLFPNYGKEPYATKLKELHATLQGGDDGS